MPYLVFFAIVFSVIAQTGEGYSLGGILAPNNPVTYLVEMFFLLLCAFCAYGIYYERQKNKKKNQEQDKNDEKGGD